MKLSTFSSALIILLSGGCLAEEQTPEFLRARNLGRLDVGEACASHSECQNLACGKTCYDCSYKCCESGGTHYVFFKGTYCNENLPKKPKGESCAWNGDCENDACGRLAYLDGDEKVCCPSGEVFLGLGYRYCTDRPEGTKCYFDSQCSGKCIQGSCKKEKLDVGEACASHSECENSACGKECYGCSYKCCESGGTHYKFAKGTCCNGF